MYGRLYGHALGLYMAAGPKRVRPLCWNAQASTRKNQRSLMRTAVAKSRAGLYFAMMTNPINSQ